MRAQEFINETLNPEVLKPGFTKTQNMGTYTLKAYVDPKQLGPNLRIDAIDNQSGQLIGATSFQPKDISGNTIKNLNQLGKDGNLEALLTDIRPDQQNKGVGSAMYNFARRMGNQLNPSSLGQTPAGKSFWDKGAGANKIGQQGPAIPGTAPSAATQPTQATQTTQPVQPAADTAKAPAWQQNARYARDAQGNLIPNTQAKVKAPPTKTVPARTTTAAPANIRQQAQNIRSQPTDWNRSSREAGYAGYSGNTTTPQVAGRPQANMSRPNLMTPVVGNNPAIAASNARLAQSVGAENARLAQNVAADQARFAQANPGIVPGLGLVK